MATPIDLYLNVNGDENNGYELELSLTPPSESLYVIFRNINDGSYNAIEVNENNENTTISLNYSHKAKFVKYTESGVYILHLTDIYEGDTYSDLITKLLDYNNTHSDEGNGVFIETEYQITVDNLITNGRIDAPSYVEYGDKAELKIIPNTFFELKSWSVNNVAQNLEEPFLIINITEDKVISATFERANYNVSISLNNDYDGEITLLGNNGNNVITSIEIVDYNNNPLVWNNDAIPGGSSITITFAQQIPEEITDETEFKYLFSSVNVNHSNNTITINEIDHDYNIVFIYQRRKVNLDGYDPVEKTYKFEVTLLNTTDIENSKVTIIWKPTIYQIPNRD
jgi:hypothetical protein